MSRSIPLVLALLAGCTESGREAWPGQLSIDGGEPVPLELQAWEERAVLQQLRESIFKGAGWVHTAEGTRWGALRLWVTGTSGQEPVEGQVLPVRDRNEPPGLEDHFVYVDWSEVALDGDQPVFHWLWGSAETDPSGDFTITSLVEEDGGRSVVRGRLDVRLDSPDQGTRDLEIDLVWGDPDGF